MAFCSSCMFLLHPAALVSLSLRTHMAKHSQHKQTLQLFLCTLYVIGCRFCCAGYCDGASHQRKDLYRQSPFDSAVMFMQTTAAAKKWPVREQLLVDLRAAMAQCCPTTAAAERQRQQRGQRDMEWLGLIPGTGLESQQSQQQHIKQRKGKRKKLSQQHRPLLEGEKHAKKSAKQRKNYKEPRAAPS